MRLGLKDPPVVGMRLGGWVQVRGAPRGSMIQGSDREMPTLGIKESGRPACLGMKEFCQSIPRWGPRGRASWSDQCLRRPQGGSVATRRSSERHLVVPPYFLLHPLNSTPSSFPLLFEGCPPTPAQGQMRETLTFSSVQLED